MKIKEIIRRNKERQRNEIISEYPCIDYLHNALHFLKSGKPEVAYSEICHAIIRSGAELSVEEKEEFKRVKASSNQTTDGKWHIGWSSRELEYVFWWLDNYFEIISYEQEIQNKAIEKMKELVRGHKYTNAEDGTTVEEMLNDENIGKKYAWYLSRNQCCDWMLHRLDEIAEQLKGE